MPAWTLYDRQIREWLIDGICFVFVYEWILHFEMLGTESRGNNIAFKRKE
jgi:hypothetical protein